jgi:hypothetical protein
MSCPKGKNVYPDFEAAKKAAGRRTWKNKKSTGDKVHPYLCAYCDQWHIGRGAKGGDQPAPKIDRVHR